MRMRRCECSVGDASAPEKRMSIGVMSESVAYDTGSAYGTAPSSTSIAVHMQSIRMRVSELASHSGTSRLSASRLPFMHTDSHLAASWYSVYSRASELPASTSTYALPVSRTAEKR